MYGQSEEGVIAKLNKAPLSVPAFTDVRFHQQKTTGYIVMIVAPGMSSIIPMKKDAAWTIAQALPIQKEPLFKLAPGMPGLTLGKGAVFTNGVLDIQGKGMA